MNPEAQMEQTVKLECGNEDCENTEQDTRAELVEKGWHWKEGSLRGLFNVFAAECPDCEDVDIKRLFEEKTGQVEDYYEKQADKKQQKLGDIA